jgi:hypothetical protein
MNPYLVNNLKISCELILTSIKNNDNKAPAIIDKLIMQIPKLDENQLLDFKNLFLQIEFQPMIPALINSSNASAQDLGFELRDHIKQQQKGKENMLLKYTSFPVSTTSFPINNNPATQTNGCLTRQFK